MDYKDFISIGQKESLSFWHQARLNLIYYILNSFLKKKQNYKILDIGCGTGTELKILKLFGQVTALDCDQPALKLAAKNNCKVILADIEKYNLKNNYYDAICCFDILEHLKHDQMVVNNIISSLKIGGYFFFTVPAYQFLYSSHDIALEHQRRYNKKEIIIKLENAGFKIIKLNYWNSLLFPFILIIRLIKKFIYKINSKQKIKSDLKNYNNLINYVLFSILNSEIILNSYKINLPFGLTIYGIAKK